MDLLINVVTAWITVILMVMLLVIYVLRLWIQKSKLPKEAWQRQWNRRLRRPHKWLGLAALISAFIHGLYSSLAILSPNKGTILFVILLLMGMSFMFRKQLKAIFPWMKIHRYLALASMVFLLLHLVEVDWFVGIDPIIASVTRDLQAKVAVEDQELFTTTSINETSDQDVTSSNEAGDGVPNNNAGSTGKGRHGNSDDSNDNDNTVTTDVEVTSTDIDTVDMSQVTIPDGTYSGEAMAFRPGLKVDVTIENNQITSVVVTDHNEVKQQFWSTPVREIPIAITEAQSTQVDVVSGATFTSIGIIDAVEDALIPEIE